jgi:hypothetical protein
MPKMIIEESRYQDNMITTLGICFILKIEKIKANGIAGPYVSA